MPLVNVRCTNCAKITKDIELKELNDFRCSCGGLTRREFNRMHFKLLGEGWGNQNYETPNRDMLKKCGDGEKFTPDEKPFKKSLF